MAGELSPEEKITKMLAFLSVLKQAEVEEGDVDPHPVYSQRASRDPLLSPPSKLSLSSRLAFTESVKPSRERRKRRRKRKDSMFVSR